MNIVEPCCFHKQIGQMVRSLEERGRGVTHFFTYSDIDLPMIVGFLGGYAEGGEVCLSLIKADKETLVALRTLVNRQVPCVSNPEVTIRSVDHVVLLMQPSDENREAVKDVLYKEVGNGLVTVIEDNIGFRCLIVGGSHTIVLQGSLNVQKSNAMQMMCLSADKESYESVRDMFRTKEHVRKEIKWEQK